MRILQVHNRHRVPGGEDAVVEQERDLLSRHGHQVLPHIVDNPTTATASAAALSRAAWNPTAARHVVASAEQFKADVVHVHNTWFSLSPATYSHLSGAGYPVVSTLHNFRTVCMNGLLMREGRACELCVGSHPGHGIAHRCYRHSFLLSSVAAATIVIPRWRRTWWRHVHRFLVLDDGSVPQLVSGGIPESRIVVHRNFAPDPGSRSQAPSRGSEVMYAGRLDTEKGVDTLLAAWRMAQPVGLTLSVYGDGPLRAELEAKAVPGVRFLGRVERSVIRSKMLGARAFVFPSRCREAGPLAPIEAAGAGLPMIISSLVGFSAEVHRRGGGWMARPDDAADLANSLSRLSDGEALDRAGRAARSLYESSHSGEVALGSLERIYDQAVLHRSDNRVNGVQT